MTGPLLRYRDLNPAERGLLNVDFIEARRLDPDSPDHTLFLSVMHSWGVICPHPQERRSYEGMYWSDDPVPFEDSLWYVCGVCECIVINREVHDG